MVCLGSRKYSRITSFLSQQAVHIILSTEGCILNFFCNGEFICCYFMDCLFEMRHHSSSLAMMRSGKLSSSASYQFNRSWGTCILCSLFSCVSICGTHVAQTLWYSNIATIVSNALKLLFPGHNPLILTDSPHFMVWQLCTAVQNFLDFHITAATTEMQHLNELFVYWI